MPVVALSACKGGTGKTTLVASLGVEASRKDQRVGILDLDPQQSVARWHELRVGETGDADHPALIPIGKYPDRTLARAVADGWDWIIVDCPPGSVRITSQAIAAADLVLIPTRPSPLDVEAIDVMVELCEQYEKDFVFVLNAIVPRSAMTAGARQFLAAKGDVLDIEIANRQSYASAMILGGTAPGKDGPARAEIAALWLAVTKRIAARKKVASKKQVAP